MNHNKWTCKRVILAIAIALVADLIQFPIAALAATGILAVPCEFLDVIMDIFVTAILSCLIGFHWLLLPSILAETIPGLDLFPTWTGCVFVLVGRKDFGNNQEAAVLKTAKTNSVIDVSALTTISPSMTPPPPACIGQISTADQFNEIKNLLENKHITQTEYDLKRQQIWMNFENHLHTSTTTKQHLKYMKKIKHNIMAILPMLLTLALLISLVGCTPHKKNNENQFFEPAPVPTPPPKPKLTIVEKFKPAIFLHHTVVLNNMSGADLSDVHISIKFVGEDAQPVITRYWASWPLGKKQTVTIPRSKVKNVQEIDIAGAADQGVFDSAWNTK